MTCTQAPAPAPAQQQAQARVHVTLASNSGVCSIRSAMPAVPMPALASGALLAARPSTSTPCTVSRSSRGAAANCCQPTAACIARQSLGHPSVLLLLGLEPAVEPDAVLMACTVQGACIASYTMTAVGCCCCLQACVRPKQATEQQRTVSIQLQLRVSLCRLIGTLTMTRKAAERAE